MPNPINHTLLMLLDNQVARTAAALEGLSEPAYEARPGGDCNSIQAICAHLLQLRRFQLVLLESPRAAEVADPETATTLDDVRAALAAAAELVAEAIRDHDPDDWRHRPEAPREGPWGDEPTMNRFVRPFNDFTNHLGAIRAIRRIHGVPNDRTQ